MSAIDELCKTVAKLRAPDGCPWDQEQDHRTLAVCLVEECSELLDTIDRLDMEHMREELGDVLVQVVFHAQLAAEKGLFDFDEVARDINEKLVRRHPHVFGDGKLDTSAQVIDQWERIKATEKKAGDQPTSSTVFKRLPPQLPALLYAHDVFKQVKKHDLDPGDAYDSKAVERLATGLDESTAGRRLFELAAACRLAGIDPESALRREASRVQESIAARNTVDG
jgi:XTP/dITP diphosphohydrolase/tetrapyrrole methylase family protein/MazG family protein